MKVKLFLILLVAFSLAGCGIFGQATPTPLPTVVLEGNNPTATPSSPLAGGGSGAAASGNVAPAQTADLALALAGNVKTVSVAVGDTVKAGQVLITLGGSEKLAAAIQAAALELLSAQQALKDLNDNAAQARAQAQLALAQAQQAVTDAQHDRDLLNYSRGENGNADAAWANYYIAVDAYNKALERFNNIKNFDITNPAHAAVQASLVSAQQIMQQKKNIVDWYTGAPTANDLAQADSKVMIAKASLDIAQRNFDALQSGPDPDALALATARIQNAQAQLAASQANLADLELKAPFDGTITQVNIHSGEWAVPGQPVIALADLGHLHVETTDLSERDVPRVQVGQAVTVRIKALNQNVNGRVTQIAPLAGMLGGDVVYKTTIELESPPAALRAGMSVDVQF